MAMPANASNDTMLEHCSLSGGHSSLVIVPLDPVVVLGGWCNYAFLLPHKLCSQQGHHRSSVPERNSSVSKLIEMRWRKSRIESIFGCCTRRAVIQPKKEACYAWCCTEGHTLCFSRRRAI